MTGRVLLSEHLGVVERIDLLATRSRVNGVMWEDVVRTVGIYPERPLPGPSTAPIDIAPMHDALQGLGTHVKAVMVPEASLRTANGGWKGKTHLASALRFFEIDTVDEWHRYVIGLYEIVIRTIGGKATEVLRFHTVIEIIQGPAAMARHRGSITKDDIRKLAADMHAFAPSFPISEERVEEAKLLFHTLTRKWRKTGDMGTARITNKIDHMQCRAQAAASLADLKDVNDGRVYHGNFDQPCYQEFHDDFYGLPLPFMTTDVDRVFLTEAQARRKAPTLPDDGIDADDRWRGGGAMREEHQVHRGIVATAMHPGGMATVRVVAGHPDMVARLDVVCRAGGGRCVDADALWLIRADKTPEVLRRMVHVPLPDAEGARIATPHPDLRGVLWFDTGIGRAHAVRMADGIALRDQGDERLGELLDATCDELLPFHAIGRYHQPYGNWIIRSDPPELIERVARAVRERGLMVAAAIAANGPDVRVADAIRGW